MRFACSLKGKIVKRRLQQRRIIVAAAEGFTVFPAGESDSAHDSRITASGEFPDEQIFTHSGANCRIAAVTETPRPGPATGAIIRIARRLILAHARQYARRREAAMVPNIRQRGAAVVPGYAAETALRNRPTQSAARRDKSHIATGTTPVN